MQSSMNGLKKYLVGVAVAVTVAILLQSATLIWWASAITVRVEFLEKGVEAVSARMERIETGHKPHS